MAVATTFVDILTKDATGGCITVPMLSQSTNATAAAANSGTISFTPFVNSIGSTLWSVLQDLPIQAGITSPLHVMDMCFVSKVGTYMLARWYKMGTLNLTATGSQFTHDTATFPLLRTLMGASSQSVRLKPFVLVTTALTTTAAAFTVTSYKDQDGTTITGTKQFTFPSATTAIGSMYALRLEDYNNTGPVAASTSVTDITTINVDTSAATGACDIWGLEIISTAHCLLATNTINTNTLTAPLHFWDANNIAAATSGTATTKLIPIHSINNAGSTSIQGEIKFFVNA